MFIGSCGNDVSSPVIMYLSSFLNSVSLMTTLLNRDIKILKVSSRTRGTSSYKDEQEERLRSRGVHVDNYYITKPGILSYIKSMFVVIKKYIYLKYDLVHSHDVSAVTTVLVPGNKRIVSFHGSDLHSKVSNVFCNVAALHAARIILSNSDQKKYLWSNRRQNIYNSGLDTELFKPLDMLIARQHLGFPKYGEIVCFGGAFDNPIKNYKLAKDAMDSERLHECLLIECKGYSRTQMPYVLNACNALLVTSLSESGPNIVKEALACNLPIISTRVGHPEIQNILKKSDMAQIVDWDVGEVRSALSEILNAKCRANYRGSVLVWNHESGIDVLLSIYKDVIQGRFVEREFPQKYT